MNRLIVDKLEPITLVGGGEIWPGDLAEARAIAPACVAADGGAQTLLQAGLMPEAVIGDFDSLSEPDKARIPTERQHHIAEQDSTDFDKALRHIASPLVVGVGFLGARLDHQLAALNTLVRHAHRPVILLAESELVFHVPRGLSLALYAGEAVSLMPFATIRGRSTGLRWPIDGLSLHPSGTISTSNAATGPIDLKMETPGLIGLIARRRLADLAAALLALSPAQRWPAPA